MSAIRFCAWFACHVIRRDVGESGMYLERAGPHFGVCASPRFRGRRSAGGGCHVKGGGKESIKGGGGIAGRVWADAISACSWELILEHEGFQPV